MLERATTSAVTNVLRCPTVRGDDHADAGGRVGVTLPFQRSPRRPARSIPTPRFCTRSLPRPLKVESSKELADERPLPTGKPLEGRTIIFEKTVSVPAVVE